MKCSVKEKDEGRMKEQRMEGKFISFREDKVIKLKKKKKKKDSE